MNQENIALELDRNLGLYPSQWKKTIQDVAAGLLCWRIWLLIAWQDIRLRYRRSQLGPLWITISMAVQIYSIGFLYGKLFGINLNNYYPYLAGGLLTWSLISTMINESTVGFVNSENYLRQMKIPYTVFTLRVLSRNIMIFLHNILVIVPIIFIFHLSINVNFLAIIPGLAIILLNGFGFGLLLSMLGARYRDINQVIQSIVQVAFFVTPIMWLPTRLPPNYQFIIDYNPFAQFLNVVRDPLIGQLPPLQTYLFTLITGIGAITLALLVFHQVRKRIIYWL